jgi:hypothetical protein
VPRRESHELENSVESEGVESENLNWAIPKESIQEMIDETVGEMEKAMRVLLEQRVMKESQTLIENLEHKFIEAQMQTHKEIHTTEEGILGKIGQSKESILAIMEENLREQKEHQQKVTGKVRFHF